jgi:hypothetical protein
VTAMPRDKNPHDPMIDGRPPAAPTDFAREQEREQRGHRPLRTG